jgi:ABC-type Fe3+/spermidine/putrescine transport system ATPase subunit
MTTVYVTHDQEEALSMSDWVVLLNDGRVAQEGPPNVLYDAPNNVFVADFVGASNLLQATVEQVDGDGGVRLRWGGLPLRAVSRRPLQVGDAVAAVIRPHRLRLGPPGVARDGDDGVVWAGTVAARAFHGAYWAYRITVDGGSRQVQVRAATPWPPGAPVHVRCPVAAVWLVDGAADAGPASEPERPAAAARRVAGHPPGPR